MKMVIPFDDAAYLNSDLSLARLWLFWVSSSQGAFSAVSEAAAFSTSCRQCQPERRKTLQKQHFDKVGAVVRSNL